MLVQLPLGVSTDIGLPVQQLMIFRGETLLLGRLLHTSHVLRPRPGPSRLSSLEEHPRRAEPRLTGVSHLYGSQNDCHVFPQY